MASIGVPFPPTTERFQSGETPYAVPFSRDGMNNGAVFSSGTGSNQGHVLDRGITGKIDGIVIIVALALAGDLVELQATQAKRMTASRMKVRMTSFPCICSVIAVGIFRLLNVPYEYSTR